MAGAQAGVVGDINTDFSSGATGGRAWMDSSNWVINRYPKPDPFTSIVQSVPWWVWVAGLGAAYYLTRGKR